MNDFILEAVSNLSPNAIISHTGTIGSIKWISIETAEPTASELEAEVTRLQAVYDSQAYARTRKAKYDLLNQDEMRFDDQANSTTTWVDTINAIKTAHPKPEE